MTIIIGGRGSSDKDVLKECLNYNFDQKNCVKYGDLIIARTYPGTMESKNSSLYVFGGWGISFKEITKIEKSNGKDF